MTALARAVDYLLAAVGDVQNEGEANAHRQAVAEEAGLELEIARVSDERGSPQDRVTAAEAQFAQAQKALDIARASAGLAPAGVATAPVNGATGPTAPAPRDGASAASPAGPMANAGGESAAPHASAPRKATTPRKPRKS